MRAWIAVAACLLAGGAAHPAAANVLERLSTKGSEKVHDIIRSEKGRKPHLTTAAFSLNWRSKRAALIFTGASLNIDLAHASTAPTGFLSAHVVKIDYANASRTNQPRRADVIVSGADALCFTSAAGITIHFTGVVASRTGVFGQFTHYYGVLHWVCLGDERVLTFHTVIKDPATDHVLEDIRWEARWTPH